MFASSAARLFILRVGVRAGKIDCKKCRFDGGWFSASLGAAAPQPLFLQEPGVAETAGAEGGSWGQVF